MSVIDSFKLAKSLFKSKNSLDALCDKLGIDRKHRTLHGALLDAELLAEVYIQMTGGSQFTLGLESQAQPVSSYAVSLESAAVLKERKETSGLTRRPAIKLRQSDMTAHQAMMQRIHKESGGQTLWSLPGRKKRAQSYMQQAEAMLLITGGAFDFKTGHDALPITKLFRDAYPAYDKQDPKKKIHIQDERIFTTFPEMAWAFYAEYINRARDAEEDEFLKQWLQLAKAKPSGYFAYTSRLDGMYQALGCDEDKIVEVYGSLHHLQCLSDCQKEVKPNNLTFELYMNELRSDVPRCPNCTQPLIPNIKLVNQSHCNPQRKETQEQALQQWLKHLEKENQRLVVVEVACNDPMVQSFANQLSEHEFVRLIRLNMHYQYGRVPESGLALNMDIHQGLALFLDD
jgi:NAD-dependent SIR2 family protein deacetylase